MFKRILMFAFLAFVLTEASFANDDYHRHYGSHYRYGYQSYYCPDCNQYEYLPYGYSHHSYSPGFYYAPSGHHEEGHHGHHD